MASLPRQLIGSLSRTRAEFFCLAALLFLDFLLMAFGTYGLYFIDNYTILPCMVFLGITLKTKHSPSARRQLLLGGAAAVWFLFTQLIHFTEDLQSRSFGVFLSVVLLAFPFAAVTEDGQKQWGLKLAGITCIGAALVLAVFTGLLYLDALPEFLRPHVFWYGTRLYAMVHPNITASIFMLAAIFTLTFLGSAKSKLQKVILPVLYLLLLSLIVLTHSRTTLIVTLFISVCWVFFFLCRRLSPRQIAAGILAFAAAAVVLLFFINGIQEYHTESMVEAYIEQGGNAETAESALVSMGGQGSFLRDLFTFNDRTKIWASVLQAMKDVPQRFIWGTDHSEPLLVQYSPYRHEHCHNAWLETLLCMGIPGLLFALIITALAARQILVTLFSHCDLWQKGIALLMLCILGVSVLEPYLFMADRYYHFINTIFFLCFGYSTQWKTKP